jgi:hypothetical protein
VGAFDRFAEVSGGGDAEAARALVGIDHTGDALAVAHRLRRRLVDLGCRYDPLAFRLDDILARRAGNCLGLTLLFGCALSEWGHDPIVVLRVNPFDDVHVAGEEHFRTLTDHATGVDADSRLPEAGDVTSRFRFVPVEHAALVLSDANGVETPFELTSLAGDPAWAPEAEVVKRVPFADFLSVVLSERAKVAIREAAFAGAVDLARAAHAAWPDNREALAEAWRAAKVLRREELASELAARYVAAGGDDSLYAMTRFRMTGDTVWLDRALARFPSYADAYFEKHVSLALEGESERDAIRRHVVVTAWMVAESEVLDLARFYRDRADDIAAAFSAPELQDVLSSFA